MAEASDILLEIAENTRQRIEKQKEIKTPEEARSQAEKIRAEELSGKAEAPADRTFLEALKTPGISYICEVKKASPSKGVIAEDFPYLEIAEGYEAAGASAVLLICSLLDDEQLREYIDIAQSLGLDALVEAHDGDEVLAAVDAGAKIIGVNNRDLRDFTVDMNNSIRLRRMAPAETVFVSESGIRTAEDIKKLRDNNVDAVLIGETLMRSSDRKAALQQLNGGPL